MSSQPRPNAVERILALFAKVEPGEGITAILMMVNVFLLLTAYLILKTVREPLILLGGMGGLDGEELKTYASAGQAFLLLGVIPAYGALASRVNRIKLLNITSVVFIVCLVLFRLLAELEVPLGLTFFLWLGIFNMFVVAQFWSYANDIYSEEQGKRLFAIIAVGGSLGAILGPRIAKIPISPYELMLVAAGILTVCMGLYNLVNAREARRLAARKAERAAAEKADADDVADAAEQPLDKAGSFQLVLRERYLLLIALMLLLANLVNTTGEFILGRAVNIHAAAEVPDSAYPELADQPDARAKAISSARGGIIKGFYADFFFWVNLIAFLVQAFLVSRIIKYIGVRTALFILPIIAFGSYLLIGAIGGFALTRAAKTAENSTDYSLQNTIRQALFLLTSREAKYKAKAAIDTFFVRTGDALAAGLVALGIHVLAFEIEHFAYTLAGVVALSIVIAAAIAREHKRLSEAAA